MSLPNKWGFSVKARRTKTLSSSRLSDISALLGGGKRHGTKTVARLELVIRLSSHLRNKTHHFRLILCKPLNINSEPLRNSGEEAEEIMQTGRASGRQQTGQQLEGWSLVFSVGQRLGCEQGWLELGGKQRLWKLPAELFDESGHVVGEGCGQTRLTVIQLHLEQTQDMAKPFEKSKTSHGSLCYYANACRSKLEDIKSILEISIIFIKVEEKKPLKLLNDPVNIHLGNHKLWEVHISPSGSWCEEESLAFWTGLQSQRGPEETNTHPPESWDTT